MQTSIKMSLLNELVFQTITALFEQLCDKMKSNYIIKI